MNGVKHTRSAPYHPATNGLAERFVQSMKQALKASLSSGAPLSQRLCNFLLTYRSTAHSTTGVTPCSLFLKREVRTRFDLLRPDQDSHVKEKQAKQKTAHDRHCRTRHFTVGQGVMAKNLRPGPDWIPATVVERLGPLSYLVETSDHQLWRRHIDHLKERVTRENTQPEPASNAEPATPTVAVPEIVQDGNTSLDVPAEPPVESGQLEVVPASETTLPTLEGSESTAPVVPVVDKTPVATTPPASPAAPVVQVPKQYPSRQHRVPNYYRPPVV